MTKLFGLFVSLAIFSFVYVASEERIDTITMTTSWCTGNGDCGMDALGSVSVKVYT